MKKLTALLPLLAFSLFAAEAPDLTMQTRIRQEGFRNSKVMEIAEMFRVLTPGGRLGMPRAERPAGLYVGFAGG